MKTSASLALNFLVLVFMSVLAGCAHDRSSQAEAALIEKTVAATQKAHGLEAWWAQDVVEADVTVVFGGKTVLEGKFFFEAHGPKARLDRKDGSSVIFDGETAWLTPSTADGGQARFHVLTWPWFIMTPFKIKGEGIHLSDFKPVQIEGNTYQSFLQTFDASMGDAPDDWYRIFVNPATNIIDAMAYIVTYGKDVKEANKKPSIIKYHDYKNFSGTQISTRYEFWYWNEEEAQFVGQEPKGTGTLSNLWFVQASESLFSVPSDAVELTLP